MVSISPQHHPWRFTAIVAGVVVAVFLIALAIVVPFRSETARKKVIQILSERLDADVELDDLRIRLLPRFRAEGHGLTVRHHGRTDVPPLVFVKTIEAEATLLTLLDRHLTRVQLEPLEIVIPPDRNREETRKPDSDDSGDAGLKMLRTFVIDELVSREGRFTIMPNDQADDDSAVAKAGSSDASKDPSRQSARPNRVWTIRQLRMRSVSVGGASPFVATVENAIPPGLIETTGSFGPWQPANPGTTPLDGYFTFDNADLGVFKGIGGILSSRGTFSGTLERIAVAGSTDTPNFVVDPGGHPVALRTTYRALVDGTNGNTLLESVDASFLRTSVKAVGGVLRTTGASGRTIKLDVNIDKGRLEDVLHLAMTGRPPMAGALKLATSFLIPPGDRSVIDKLQLKGWFTIDDARFTSPETQTKINDLSHRTRGRDSDERVERVSSQFAGSFALNNAVLSLPHVTFDVPGAAIRLAGTYGLTSEQIDFRGAAFTDAKISEMTSGFTSLLLKPLDLIFKRKAGGAEIPISIGGTRKEPSFGLDKGKVLTGPDEPDPKQNPAQRSRR